MGSTFGLALPAAGPARRARPRLATSRRSTTPAGRRRHRGRPQLGGARRGAPRGRRAAPGPPCARARRGWRRSGHCAPRPSSSTSTCPAWTAGTCSARSRPTRRSRPPRSSSSPCCPNGAVASRSGPSDYLVKPVSKEGLLGAVWRAVAERVDQSSARRDVVVIDDDPAALELVRATLEPHGWTVTTCTGGAEALSVIRAAAPVGRARRPAHAGRRRLRGHRRAAGGPAHGRDPGRRAHREVADGAGPPPAAGPHRVRGVEGRARPQLARRPADPGRGRRRRRPGEAGP